MKLIMSLDKNWKLAAAEYGGTNISRPLDAREFSMDAQVPGDIHLDLMRKRLLPDLYQGMNCDHALWTESKDWWYRTEFSAPLLKKGDRAFLIFHGLDCFATVWVNKTLVGKTDNMFIRHEFDVSSLLQSDRKNELVVRLGASAYEIEIDRNHGPLSWGNNWRIWSPEKLFCRKAQMSFGWDIAPRLVTCGIWRPVELLICHTARITDIFVRQTKVNKNKAMLDVTLEFDWFGANHPVAISFKIGDVKKMISCVPRKGQNKKNCRIEIPDPRLWWPLGYGKPELYDFSVAMRCGEDLLDTRSMKVGLRTLPLVQEPQPSRATSFKFRCNDKDLFITGLNWTPHDAIFGRVKDADITRTLEQLSAIECNMLRIWGGGIYENDHFYQECDRLGILVWQDFMMACAWYPQTKDFAAKIEKEARTIVKDLRNHACIALWAGDNEVDQFWPHLAVKNKLTRKTLKAVCSELAPDTSYVPSSPATSSNPADPENRKEGDLHYYNHGSHYRDPANWNIRCRFLAEFGHLSLPSLKTIREYFTPSQAWPLSTPEWKYHGANVIHVEHFRGPDKILSSLKASGKSKPRNIAEAVKASQALQAEALCGWIERYSEDPEFGGFLLWNVRDNWPQFSDAIIDYAGREKAVFKKLGPLFRRLKKQHGSQKPQT